MKLVSMKWEHQRRAGLVIGDEVIDVTDFCEIVEEKGEWIDTASNVPIFHHIEGAYRDAVDLLRAGEEWLRSIVARLGDDPILADECRKVEALRPLNEVSLAAPIVRPGKILAVGLNYRAHADETNSEVPGFPLIFSKNVTALIGPGESIRIPAISDLIDYEGELAVVMGKRTRSVAACDAMEHVGGYTIMNDVTARDLQKRERQWARAKGLDTFAPCGPWLITRGEIADPHALTIRTSVNGELRQDSRTSEMIFNIPRLIEFISEDLTLEPGDIISTGTPPGVGYARKPPVFLKHGDEVAIEMESIGVLSNPVE